MFILYFVIAAIITTVCVHNGIDAQVFHPIKELSKFMIIMAMAAIGLMPAALRHGIGSESQRPLAIVIIGGVLCDTFFTLFIFPLIVEVIYGKTLYDKEGKLRQRRV